MTLTIELPAEVEAKLNSAAARQGVAPSEYVVELIRRDESIGPKSAAKDPTLALFEQWAAEDATDDPEELARREQEWEEIKRNMNQNRIDSDGPNARIPFPESAR